MIHHLNIDTRVKSQAYGHLWTWGGGDLIARKKLHNARKNVLYKRTQIAVKTKTLPFITSNERIIIPKLKLNTNFCEPQRETKIGSKNGIFREIWAN